MAHKTVKIDTTLGPSQAIADELLRTNSYSELDGDGHVLDNIKNLNENAAYATPGVATEIDGNVVNVLYDTNRGLAYDSGINKLFTPVDGTTITYGTGPDLGKLKTVSTPITGDLVKFGPMFEAIPANTNVFNLTCQLVFRISPSNPWYTLVEQTVSSEGSTSVNLIDLYNGGQGYIKYGNIGADTPVFFTGIGTGGETPTADQMSCNNAGINLRDKQGQDAVVYTAAGQTYLKIKVLNFGDTLDHNILFNITNCT